MDEVYTCTCGCQEWSIHDGFVRCLCCHAEYKTENECPSKFNKEVKEMASKDREE